MLETRTGIVLVGPEGRVLQYNLSAAALLLADRAPRETLAQVLDDAEKFGLIAAGAKERILKLCASGGGNCQFDTVDGRSIHLAASSAEHGQILLEFIDVTPVVRSVRNEQRDPLTGLPNRVALLERLASILTGRDGVSGQPALLYIDLDRFKSVNDTLGHAMGDLVLKRVVDRMGRVLEDGDMLVRLGGDEFGLLQVGKSQPHAAEALGRKLIDIVGRAYLLQGNMVNLGVSIGVALAPADGDEAGLLIKNADLALFKAKSDGRGTLRFFTDDLNRRVQARRALEVDMRRALALREFDLAYQPQYDVGTKQLVGFEALLRWTHAERGVVSPADFIPLAEETGLIVPLGEWVLRTACRQAASWPAPLSVSINLSPVQFRTPELVPIVLSALGQAGLDPSRLDIEITEGALLDNTESVVAILEQIKALGARVSMDDFGTGYSSLSYLQKFAFDKIKIDQSFVRGVVSQPDSAAIVRAVAALGASLGMTTIAEGVETQAQLDEIGRFGCNQVQGYLTGRPLTAQAAAALIASVSARD